LKPLFVFGTQQIDTVVLFDSSIDDFRNASPLKIGVDMNAVNYFEEECGPIEWTLSALDENNNAISDITFIELSKEISVPSSLDWVTANDFDRKRFVTL